MGFTNPQESLPPEDSATLAVITDYVGNGGKFLRVNAGETATEYAVIAGGGDMLAANNLSDVVSQQTSLNNVTNVAAATDEHVLTKDTATGNCIFKAAAGGGAVSSVFGRTGAVVAVAGDYTASEVTNVAAGNIVATDVQAAINELDTEKGAVASPLSQFAATTSAQFFSVISDETGTGLVVGNNAPTFIAPALGTPASGVLTNCTGTAAGLTAGSVTGFTPASGSLTLSGADAVTLTTTAATNVTLPTTGTLSTLAGTETITNKEFDSTCRTTSVPINTQTGTTYTLVLTDAGKVVTLNNAAAIALTIPTNASVAFPVGTQITLIQLGAGLVTATGATGVTVNGVSAGNKATTAAYEGLALLKTATNTWVIVNK